MPHHQDLQFERYVHLAGLTHNAALLSWGGFFFRLGGCGGTAAAGETGNADTWMVVDDEYFKKIRPARKDSIGPRSKPYGVAVVDEAGRE